MFTLRKHSAYRARRRAVAAGPALPFDGDRTMSMILSKAFLLVEDDKITDPTILRQIG